MVIQPSDKRVSRLIERLRDKDEIRILFVCLGNICRSPAAEGLMLEVVAGHDARQHWVIDSAGTGNYHTGDLPDKRMRIHARRRGVELTHICRQVRESDFEDFDMIIGMDDSNIARLRRIAPTPDDEEKVVPCAAFFGRYRHFDHVPDPYYDGDDGFETVLDILTDATQNIYDTLSR